MPKHIEYLYVPAVDSETFDISQYFSCVNSFIEEEKKRTNILVHCMAGISRSITLIAAFLMKERQLSFEEVFSFLKSKRSIVTSSRYADSPERWVYSPAQTIWKIDNESKSILSCER